jgi:enamine deaminase RidA (YjgF/YER057c/UK114 family)
MRDIQSDLQERATLINEQIRAACAHFERILEKLQNERDARIADLQSGLAMIAKFTELEQQFFGSVSPPVPSSPLVALADLFMRKLNEVGPMSREELVDMAVKQGFFPDAETALQGVHPMVVNMLRSELIRELPNGTFAPPTMSQAIKLRRVV